MSSSNIPQVSNLNYELIIEADTANVYGVGQCVPNYTSDQLISTINLELFNWINIEVNADGGLVNFLLKASDVTSGESDIKIPCFPTNNALITIQKTGNKYLKAVTPIHIAIYGVY